MPKRGVIIRITNLKTPPTQNPHSKKYRTNVANTNPSTKLYVICILEAVPSITKIDLIYLFYYLYLELIVVRIPQNDIFRNILSKLTNKTCRQSPYQLFEKNKTKAPLDNLT
jgi:hypothetical protein